MEIEELKKHFESQRDELKNKKNEFNIFTVLHDETDERRLHSRFIAYLLSKRDFLELFLKDVLKIQNTKFNIMNYKVLPDTETKSEYEDIDILVYNDTQAIIIENKIFAGDSNHLVLPKDDKYRGQLQRYYTTISQGVNKNNQEINIGKKEVVKVVYLTLDRHEPSVVSKKDIPIEKIKLIDYTQEIKDWLSNCIYLTDNNNNELALSIKHYKSLIENLTSDVKRAKKDQELLSENISKALELRRYFIIDCFEVFKHIQWHTVDKFFNELEEGLEQVGAYEVKNPELEEITKVTHNKNKSSITKLIVKFKYNDSNLQIVNDAKGFTLGNLSIRKWGNFSDEISKIRFNDFTNETTFCMINKDYRKKVIEKIIDEMKENYSTLENVFK